VTIESIKARLEAAAVEDLRVCADEQTVRDGNGEIWYDRSEEGGTEWGEEYAAKAFYVAHAPTDLRALLKVAEAAKDYRDIQTGLVSASLGAALTRKGLEEKAAEVLDAALAEMEGME
jgi:hypothetical protein